MPHTRAHLRHNSSAEKSDFLVWIQTCVGFVSLVFFCEALPLPWNGQPASVYFPPTLGCPELQQSMTRPNLIIYLEIIELLGMRKIHFLPPFSL